MKGKLLAAKRRAASLRFGNPARSLDIVLVAGNYGMSITAEFLKGILNESGRKAGILPSRYRQSVTSYYEGLSKAKKQGISIVIVIVDEAFLHTEALGDTLIDSVILTTEFSSFDRLLSLSPQHVVVPSAVQVPSGSVEPYQHITVGDDEASDAKLDTVTLYRKGTEITLVLDHQTTLELATHTIGYSNAHNLATAIAAAYVSGVEKEHMQEGVADIMSLEGQFERLSFPDKQIDCYVDTARDELSLRNALRTAAKLKKRRLLVVLDDDVIDRTLIDATKEYADRIFIVDYDGTIPSGVEVVSTTHDGIEKAVRASKQDDFILLAGRAFTGSSNEKMSTKDLLKDIA